jgi:hypothetical protein
MHFMRCDGPLRATINYPQSFFFRSSRHSGKREKQMTATACERKLLSIVHIKRAIITGHWWPIISIAPSFFIAHAAMQHRTNAHTFRPSAALHPQYECVYMQRRLFILDITLEHRKGDVCIQQVR